MSQNNVQGRRRIQSRAANTGGTHLPRPRGFQRNRRNASRTDGQDRYLLTARDLLILLITSVVGLSAAVVSGLTVATQTSASLGTGFSLVLGIAAGVVALVTTALVVANRLHRLVQ